VLDFLGDAVVVEFFGTEEGLDLAVVGIWILQDRSDHLRLVPASDGGVSAIGERESQDPLGVAAYPRPVDPFQEERGPQMGGDQCRAVE
jgi:hypothetical protein